MIHTTFTELVAAQYPYDWEKGPRQVRNNQAAEGGANCMAITHLGLYGLYGLMLPSEQHCFEMYADITSRGRFFRTVEGGWRNMQLGDVVLYGRDRPDVTARSFHPRYDDDQFLLNYPESPVEHAAIFTGEYDPDTGEPRMLHTSRSTGIEITTQAAIMKVEPHAAIKTVGRLIIPQSLGEAA